MYSIKGKEMVENAAQIPIATIIAPGMFKLDLDPLASRLLKNRDAHIDYLKYTQEQADILQGIVKQAKAKQPLDNVVDFACKNAKQIQELLVYVLNTCPNATKPSEKLLVVTPINKVKKVRFSKPLTSSSNIHKQVESSKTPESNKPVLPSIGLKSSTSVSRSQPTSNTKNDRISQTPSSNMKNKVEAQLRTVNLRNHFQLMNFVSKFLGTVRFRNDQIAKIMGYGDCQLRNVTISRLYYVEGLRHNLFSIGQFCDSDLEVSFTEKHLLNSEFRRKRKKSSHQSKAEDTNQEKLYLLDMDLCGAIHVENINGKKYIMDNPWHVYKVNKALYGLKQAPRAWYDMLSSFLISQHFSKETPMVEKNKLDANLQGKQVDATHCRGMIGSLMYLTSSRPDLIHDICLCARYQAKPTEKHLHAVKRIFRYLKGTIHLGLCKIPLYCDNKSAITLCGNNVQHSRSKHIDVRYHFIKEQVENGVLELYFVRTEYQLADIFTKALPREIFNFLIKKLGMRSMSSKTLKSLAEEEDE
ncbi:retrovirus-related pol polyprotein from transposon TNT 1-94 [Tanacetum coccineum]